MGSCANNYTMSRDCIWDQPADYRNIYILHFVSGAWILASFVLDGVQMWWWCLCCGERPMTALFSHAAIFPSYAVVLSACVLGITLTWTAIVEWNTDGLNRLLAILIALVL